MAKENVNRAVSDLIIYEDEHILVLNKPSGVLSIPDRKGESVSLNSLLKQHYNEIFTVHRLDKDTSGLILFAKHAEAHRHFSLQFQERKTRKIYQAILTGRLFHRQGTIDLPIREHPSRKGTMISALDGKDAVTDYSLLEQFHNYCWVEFRIHTGRTHQIRVHAQELGHPVVADPLYGDGQGIYLSRIKNNYKSGKKVLEEKPLLCRLALHASELEIMDMQQHVLKLQAPLWKDMKAALNQLRKFTLMK